jgi:NADH:ubiquinone oxidoreductase subunit K
MDRERHGRTVIEQLIIYIRRNVIRNLFVTLTLMKRFQTDIFLFENKTYRRQGYLFLFFFLVIRQPIHHEIVTQKKPSGFF